MRRARHPWMTPSGTPSSETSKREHTTEMSAAPRAAPSLLHEGEDEDPVGFATPPAPRGTASSASSRARKTPSAWGHCWRFGEANTFFGKLLRSNGSHAPQASAVGRLARRWPAKNGRFPRRRTRNTRRHRPSAAYGTEGGSVLPRGSQQVPRVEALPGRAHTEADAATSSTSPLTPMPISTGRSTLGCGRTA